MKKIRFSHKSQEMDYNQYQQQQKYLSILEEEDDSDDPI
jgi:hypothetical protein